MSRLHRRLAILATVAIVVEMAPIPAVVAAEPDLPRPTIVITSDMNPAPVLATVTFTARVVPDPGPAEVTWGLAGEAQIVTPLQPGGVVTLSRAFSTPGTKQIQVAFFGNETYGQARAQPYDQSIEATPASIEIKLPPDPIPEGPATATVRVMPDPGGGILRWTLGVQHETPVGPGGVTTLDLGTLRSGGHALKVYFPGYGIVAPASQQLSFKVLDITNTSLVSDRSEAIVGELPVRLTVAVTGIGIPNGDMGAVTIEDEVGGVVHTFGPLSIDPIDQKYHLSTSSLRVGTHTLRATYQGSTWQMPSKSAPITVIVRADEAVHATFASSLDTFYPFKDRYLDTVTLAGVLDERATVTIRIFDSRKRLKRTIALGSQGTGAFRRTWDGRAGRAMLEPGRYEVRAEFKDASGHSRSISDTVRIRSRRVTWKKAVLTKRGDEGTFFVDRWQKGRLYRSPVYAHGIIFDSGPMERRCTECGEALGRYVFSLKRGLAYRGGFIDTFGHGFTDREDTGAIYFVHPASGLRVGMVSLREYCRAPAYRCITRVSPSWVSTRGTLETWIWMHQESGSAFDLAKLQLTYRYAVWASAG